MPGIAEFWETALVPGVPGVSGVPNCFVATLHNPSVRILRRNIDIRPLGDLNARV